MSLGTGKGPYVVDLKRIGGDFTFKRNSNSGATEGWYDLDEVVTYLEAAI